MSLKRQVAHNTIIQFGGKFIGTILGVITIGIMARYLGTKGFGQYSTIMAFLQFFGILVDMGLAVTVVRLIADPQHDQRQIINNILTLRFFSAIIFLGLAPLVVIFFPYDNLIKLGVAIASLSFLFISLNQILIGLFQKELKMDRVTISEVLGRLILLILVAIFAYTNSGLLWIVAAVVLGSLINFVLNFIFAHKYVQIQWAFDWDIWKKIISLTWPIAISIAFNLVYFKADTVILSLVRTQAEVGIYSAPYRVLEILINFIFVFMGIILPLLTATWASQQLTEFKNIFQKTFDFLIILSVPMVVGTLFVAKPLMLLIAGPEFSESGLVLQIIIFATAIISVNALFGYTIIVLDKQKQMIAAYILVAIVALTGYLLTIPQYGYFGAATFTIISEALIFIFNFYVVTRTIKFLPSGWIILKSLGASLVMAVLLYILNGFNILLQIALASLVYILALYLCKGFSKEFILEILSKKSVPQPTQE